LVAWTFGTGWVLLIPFHYPYPRAHHGSSVQTTTWFHEIYWSEVRGFTRNPGYNFYIAVKPSCLFLDSQVQCGSWNISVMKFHSSNVNIVSVQGNSTDRCPGIFDLRNNELRGIRKIQHSQSAKWVCGYGPHPI
jgi:hypothetical protein